MELSKYQNDKPVLSFISGAFPTPYESSRRRIYTNGTRQDDGEANSIDENTISKERATCNAVDLTIDRNAHQ